MAFRCNRCYANVGKSCYITRCSHMFCYKCSKEWFTKHSKCPVCASHLKSERDLRNFRMNSTEISKLASETWGLSPSQILEVCASGLAFWENQKNEEIKYRQKQVVHKDKRNREFVAAANQKLLKAQSIINAQRQKARVLAEEIRRKTEENRVLHEQLKEKSRQRDKYAELYNTIRGRSIQQQRLGGITPNKPGTPYSSKSDVVSRRVIVHSSATLGQSSLDKFRNSPSRFAALKNSHSPISAITASSPRSVGNFNSTNSPIVRNISDTTVLNPYANIKNKRKSPHSHQGIVATSHRGSFSNSLNANQNPSPGSLNQLIHSSSRRHGLHGTPRSRMGIRLQSSHSTPWRRWHTLLDYTEPTTKWFFLCPN